MTYYSFKDRFLGRKFKCLETGVVVTLTSEVIRPRAFIPIGNGAIDLGDGFYTRYLGKIEELLESETMKPDWNNAPKWATLIAQDRDGTWFWYENDDLAVDGNWWTTDCAFEAASLGEHNWDWRESKEYRPT